jgi:hypothetical protein
MSKVTNEELVQKAVNTTDVIASAGRLNAKQSDKFIDYVVDMSGLKGNARIVRVNTDWEVDKIGIGTRVAVPKAEASAPSVRRALTTSKLTLTPKVIMVPWELSDELREENLEGASIEDHVIKMMAAQLANDLEELYLNGETAAPATLEGNIIDGGSATQYIKDTYLALMNGWLAQCRIANTESHTANIVDIAGASVGPTVFSQMLKAMPFKFKRNMQDLRFISSMDLEQNYREKMATRQGPTGESALNSIQGLTPFGVPIHSYPLFPFHPRVTKNFTFPNDTSTATSLDFAPIVSGSEVVVPQTINNVPTTKYVKDTDYTMDYAAGTITAKGGTTPALAVKVTYQVAPQIMLANYRNFVIAIGRDITIERDRDIFKGVNQYAITAKIACIFEEPQAVVWAKNIGDTV